MLELIVFAVALATRLSIVLTSTGGLGGNFGYDASVYYAAADSFTFGRLPYRDFVLLHPPGIMLALTPFAWLGRMTTDHAGFMTAAVAFSVLGAVNAGLVARIARRIGLPSYAALIGGLFYALWMGSSAVEIVGRLEPLGSFLFLCGLLAVFAARDSGRRRTYVLAGLALGAAVGVKIWWIVPALVVLAWQLTRTRRAQLPAITLGAATALALVYGPFFLAAPSTMWHMVVTEQLGRPSRVTSLPIRLDQLSWMTGEGRLGVTQAHALAMVLGALSVGALVLAWRVRPARLFVVLAVCQTLLLLRAPSWFPFYADYLAPTAALCLAAAVGPSRSRERRWVRPLVVAVPGLCALIAAGATLTYLLGGKVGAVWPAPATSLAADASQVRCVMSNSPMGLILIDSLSRDLRNGCRNWVDVTGRSYGIGPAPSSRGAAHLNWDQWQPLLRSYLFSGQAVILVTNSGAQLDRQTHTTLVRSGILARSGGDVIYLTPAGARAPAHAQS
jgi:hypothetical protein